MAYHLYLSIITSFTKSLRISTFPGARKRGYVIPVHKKGDWKLVDNYCPITFTSVIGKLPITFTSVIGKLLKSIIKDTLDHFMDNNLFSPDQHRFLQRRSCATQLHSVNEYWTKSFVIGDLVYFDFHKASTLKTFIKAMYMLTGFRVTYFDGQLIFLIGTKQN